MTKRKRDAAGAVSLFSRRGERAGLRGTGMETARAFILPFVTGALTDAAAEEDYKTKLQEILQQNPEERLRYVVTDESGPDHNKHFVVEVHLNSNCIGKGEGHSKKLAEQQAAKEALALMGY